MGDVVSEAVVIVVLTDESAGELPEELKTVRRTIDVYLLEVNTWRA